VRRMSLPHARSGHQRVGQSERHAAPQFRAGRQIERKRNIELGPHGSNLCSQLSWLRPRRRDLLIQGTHSANAAVYRRGGSRAARSARRTKSPAKRSARPGRPQVTEGHPSGRSPLPIRFRQRHQISLTSQLATPLTRPSKPCKIVLKPVVLSFAPSHS